MKHFIKHLCLIAIFGLFFASLVSCDLDDSKPKPTPEEDAVVSSELEYTGSTKLDYAKNFKIY